VLSAARALRAYKNCLRQAAGSQVGKSLLTGPSPFLYNMFMTIPVHVAYASSRAAAPPHDTARWPTTRGTIYYNVKMGVVAPIGRFITQDTHIYLYYFLFIYLSTNVLSEGGRCASPSCQTAIGRRVAPQTGQDEAASHVSVPVPAASGMTRAGVAGNAARHARDGSGAACTDMSCRSAPPASTTPKRESDRSRFSISSLGRVKK
jgi:hypothetical protein